MKHWLSILILTLFFSSSSYGAELRSNLKQSDEYTCGPVSSYNLIIDICNNYKCTNEKVSLEEIIKLQKTTKKGTTTNNICTGLKKILKKQNIDAEIKYCGIKKVKSEFKTNENYSPANFSNQYAILNFGVYTRDSQNNYIRQWGHYVNLISADDKSVEIIDSYNKEDYITQLNYKAVTDINLINKNDNEKYNKSDEIYMITSPVKYLRDNEYAIINGIISIKTTSQK